MRYMIPNYKTPITIYPEGLDVVGTVRTPGEIAQVKLDLVPSLVQSHGHGTWNRENMKTERNKSIDEFMILYSTIE